MRYTIKNLGPGAFYCVDRAKLLKVGDAVEVGRIDDGTARLADGPKPRLEITVVEEGAPKPGGAAATATSAPSSPRAETAPPAPAAPPTNGKAKDAPKAARGAAQDVAPRPPAEVKSASEPAAPAAPAVPAGDVIK